MLITDVEIVYGYMITEYIILIIDYSITLLLVGLLFTYLVKPPNQSLIPKLANNPIPNIKSLSQLHPLLSLANKTH